MVVYAWFYALCALFILSLPITHEVSAANTPILGDGEVEA